MTRTTTDVFAEPGDLFTPGSALDGDRATVRLSSGEKGPLALTIFADLPTLLALADSLVAAAWTLKTAADAAAAPFTPADPEQAAEG